MADRPVGEHEFGGVSTDLKLSIVEGYLRAFTTALKPSFRELIYIDAFAGTGERTVRDTSDEASLFDADTPDRIQRLRGSARIAIETRPPFDRLAFIDRDPKHCEALRALKSEHANRSIAVEEGDAATILDVMLAQRSWSGCRGVLFLDPFGMSVPWETLQSVRATEALDVWYLVSLAGLFRQAARDGRALTPDKRAAITRMLGYGEWEAEWYRQPSQGSFFDEIEEAGYRVADVKAIEQTVTRRLKSLFPAVGGPLRLHNDRGQPMNSLYFLPSNPKPAAFGLAMKIANHILKAGSSSHKRPR
ncbi:MAG: three-Cys-motif partner protein TcmP [Caulobacterales bacterium]